MPVYLAAGGDYGDGRLRPLLERALAELGLDAVIRPGDRVLLKPNLIAPRPPESAVCTHPEVVRAVAGLLRDLGARLYLGDSPGYASLERCLERSGLAAVMKEMDIARADFTRRFDCHRPENRVLRRFQLAAAVREYDHLVNLAKLKTHGMMGLTLAVKNLFGCLVGFDKARWHLRAGHDRRQFARLLLDIYQTVAPVFNLVDGIVAMEGEGPTGGRPVALGIIGLAADGIALDYALERLVNYPEATPVTHEALAAGWLRPERLEYRGRLPAAGMSLQPARGARSAAFFGHRLLRRLVVRKPVVSFSRCHRCLVCVKHCPAGVMKFVDGSVRINYNGCIRCYCCQELCPHGAVTVRWGWGF